MQQIVGRIVARCLRCKAGNEWIEGDVRRSGKDGVALTLTSHETGFLRALLQTHEAVCTPETADLCGAILKKIARNI
jgi:hypothetical protein